MRIRPFSSRRPSPAAVIAILSLLVALSGGAIAKDQINRDEVSNITVTGSLAATSDPSDEPSEPHPGEPIPLSSTTFTQKAGEVLMASGFVDISGVEQGEATCDLVVVVRGLGPTQGWDFMLEMFQLARRGDGGDRVDDEILPAPTSDQTITLDARAEEIDVEGSDFGEGDCTDDTFAVDLRLTLTTLRD